MDPSGDIYVTGSFQDTATFGAGEANETLLTAAGASDIFVAKYAPDGSLLWATSAGDLSSDVAAGIATDPSGNSYVTGSFHDATVSFACLVRPSPCSTIFTARGMFTVKHAADGTLLWAKSEGGSGSGIATDPSGDIYVTGSFQDTATFGAGEANETLLVSAGGQDISVIKYVGGEDSDGDDDGVPDEVDFCPDTALPEAVPTSGRLLPNHFALTDYGPAFSTNARGASNRVSFTILDTQGCSCEQIIDHLGLGNGHRKHGCSLGVMRTFIEQLPE